MRFSVSTLPTGSTMDSFLLKKVHPGYQQAVSEPETGPNILEGL